ncbi:hypothetical protein FRC04_006079 [Tulasnella sp. 424]|nr:hypothetical protein FRC04_006079 [Tulasnella sp. 424]KAG8961370.1 hypothetical protein FRC05_006238 [Tulasnella sp. 425]
MSDDAEEALADALEDLNGLKPATVATALPGFHYGPSVEARLLLSWDEDFAATVLTSWTPSDDTWTEAIRHAADDNQVLGLLLNSLGTDGARRRIAEAAEAIGGGRLARLMKSLRSTINAKKPSKPAEAPSHPKTPPLPVPGASLAKLSTQSDSITTAANPPTKHDASSPPQPQPVLDSVKHPGLPAVSGVGVIAATSRRDEKQNPASIEELFAADDAVAPLAQASPVRTQAKPSLLGGSGPFKDVSNVHAPLPSQALIPRSPNSDRDHHQYRGVKASSNSKSTRPGEGKHDTNSPVQDENRHQGISFSKTAQSRAATPPSSPLGSRKVLEKAHPASQRLRAASFPAIDDLDLTDESLDSPAPSLGDGTDGAVDKSPKPTGEEHKGTEDSEIKAATVAMPINNDDNNDDNDDGSKEDWYPDGYVDPTAIDPWKWSQDKNDERVILWEVEEMIELDPRSTAPVRAKWMYEARKGDMDDDKYAAMMDNEHRAFLAIPVACRTALGQMWYKDSKLDWEIRVFWAPLVFQYAMLKDKLDDAEERGDEVEIKSNEAERKSLADEAMAKLLNRFPDCSPSHEKRRIREQFGTKAEGKYIARFRNKFTSDAGRMKRLYQESVGKISMLGASTSLSTLLEILGRKRAQIAYHLWGGSEAGGKVECDVEIELEMEQWVAKNPKATPQEATHYRLQVVQSVRSDRFGDLDESVKQIWTRRAKAIHKPKTIEEEQCLVDASLPYVVDLLNTLADRANMHFVLLASSRGSCNVPIVIQEFARKDAEQTVFLSATAGLGARVRTDYLTYAVNRFGGDVSEAVIGVPVETVKDGTGDDFPTVNGSKGRVKKQLPLRQSYIPPFNPEVSEMKTSPKMAKAISDFFISSIHTLHDFRPTWDKLIKSAHLYIDPLRMPMDPDIPGQRLQFQKPGAMTDSRVKALFFFLIESYNGKLSEEERFRFRLESRHSNLPAPAPPPDPNVHHAAAVAARTNLTKRRQEKLPTDSRKRKRDKTDFDESGEEDLEDLAEIMQEADVADLEDALNTGGAPKPKMSGKRRPLRIESPPPTSSNSTKPPFVPARPTPQESQPITSAPDRPVKRTRPRTKSVPDIGTDELSHPLFIPGDERVAHLWAEDRLDVWGRNMTYAEEQSRTMPFRDISGTKPDIELPGGLYSSFSILQLWSAYQGEQNGEAHPDVKILPFLGLNTIHPSHHISKIIALLTDPEKPLPSAKFVYVQSTISPEAAEALFLHLEQTVSRFTNDIVASEDTVLEANISLLQGMRLAVFMAATGFIRDGTTKEVNTIRTSALSDRLVEIVAAVAFARYFKVILGRVAKLYIESSQLEAKASMWKELDKYAFTARPWWTPGTNGAPGPIKIKNKQSVVSDALINLLEGLEWSKLTFIERGHILLILFLGAIQIENDRFPLSSQGAEANETQARALSRAVQSLRNSVEESSEIGPVQNPIVMPLDTVPHWISKWEMECQVIGNPESSNPVESVDVSMAPHSNDPSATGDEKTVPSAPEVTRFHDPQTPVPVLSSKTDQSIVPPEDEDHVFEDPPANHPVGVQPSQDFNETGINEQPPSAHVHVPAVRALEEAVIPPAKKRRTREVEPVSVDEAQQPGRALRSRLLPKQSTSESTANATQAATPVAASGAKKKTPAKGRGGSGSRGGASGQPSGRGRGRGRGAGRGRGS